MTRHNGSSQPSFGILALLVAVVIVYGSLFPFEFHPHPAPGGPVAALLATWRQSSSRGDLIANVLLYMPLGFFLVLAFQIMSPVVGMLLATICGLCLCTAIELAQFYDAGRATAMSDVYCNTGGTLLGAIAGAVVGPDFRIPLLGNAERRPVALMLIVSFLGYRLFPYAPTIDLHKYLRAVEPLLSPSAFPIPPEGIYRHAVIFLALAFLLEAVLGAARRRIAFCLFVAAVLLSRIAIIDAALSPAEVAGAGLALVVWIGVVAGLPFRAALVALLFAGLIVVQGLEPFQFQPVPRRFGWIPFLSFMQGSLETNVRSLFEKTFLYGGMLWLLMQSGWRLGAAAPATAALVLAVRYAQIYLPGRSAEITDFVIVVMLALVMKLVPEGTAPAQQAESRPRWATTPTIRT